MLSSVSAPCLPACCGAGSPGRPASLHSARVLPPSTTCCAALDLVRRSFGGFQPSTPAAVLGKSKASLPWAQELRSSCPELVSVLVCAELPA